jgi:hypothetical protein
VFGSSCSHTTQHNTTQHNTTQHNTTQHNTTQHNTTQHNTRALIQPGSTPLRSLSLATDNRRLRRRRRSPFNYACFFLASFICPNLCLFEIFVSLPHHASTRPLNHCHPPHLPILEVKPQPFAACVRTAHNHRHHDSITKVETIPLAHQQHSHTCTCLLEHPCLQNLGCSCTTM